MKKLFYLVHSVETREIYLLSQKIFREINSLLISSVSTLFSRKKNRREYENFHNFHAVHILSTPQ